MCQSLGLPLFSSICKQYILLFTRTSRSSDLPHNPPCRCSLHFLKYVPLPNKFSFKLICFVNTWRKSASDCARISHQHQSFKNRGFCASSAATVAGGKCIGDLVFPSVSLPALCLCAVPSGCLSRLCTRSSLWAGPSTNHSQLEYQHVNRQQLPSCLC